MGKHLSHIPHTYKFKCITYAFIGLRYPLHLVNASFHSSDVSSSKFPSSLPLGLACIPLFHISFGKADCGSDLIILLHDSILSFNGVFIRVVFPPWTKSFLVSLCLSSSLNYKLFKSKDCTIYCMSSQKQLICDCEF